MEVDTRAIAAQALEEVEALASGGRVRLIPDPGPAATTLSELKALEPVPRLEALEVVIREAFWASLATDEGRPCRLRLGYCGVPRHRSATERRLEQPMVLSRDALRKFAALHDARFGSVLWDEAPDASRVEIVGLDGARAGYAPHQVAPRFAVLAPSPGSIKISWSGHTLVSVVLGRTLRFSQCALAGLPALADFLGDPFRVVAGLLGGPVREIADAMHGGALWLFLGDGDPVDVRIEHRIVGERGRDDGWHPADAIALVGKLAAADGAVLIDSSVSLRGFSSFFVGAQANVNVRWLHADGSVADRTVSSLGGARHRSTAGFCVSNRPAVGIVVSQDGHVTVLVADRDRDDLRGAAVAEVGLSLH